MTERDVHTLQAEALVTLAEAIRTANGVRDVESALGHLMAAMREVLGDQRRTSVHVDSELVNVSSWSRASF
jgi:hypothetical protein